MEISLMTISLLVGIVQLDNGGKICSAIVST